MIKEISDKKNQEDFRQIKKEKMVEMRLRYIYIYILVYIWYNKNGTCSTNL